MNVDEQRSRILGELRSVDGKGAVHMQYRYATEIDDLWSAVTDPVRLLRWIGEIDGDLRVGGTFRAHFVSTGWEGTGSIEACSPPHHFLVRTRDDDSLDEHTIEATLTADGDHTVLVIEERGMPVEHLAGYGAGIQGHVKDLGAYLAGHERRDPQDRWAELLPEYQVLADRVS